MEKFLTKTPIASCSIFLMFIIIFGFLTSNYKVTVYEPLNVKAVDIDMEENILNLKCYSLNNIEKNSEIQLVYSTQEQVIRGTILDIDKKRKILIVKFKHLNRVTLKQIRESEFKYAHGKEPIGRDLKL